MAQILRGMGNILRDDGGGSGSGGGAANPTPTTVTGDLRAGAQIIDPTKAMQITCTGQVKSANGTTAGDIQLLVSPDAFATTSLILDQFSTFSTTFQQWNLQGVVPAGYSVLLNSNNGTTGSVSNYIKQPLG